MTDEATKRAWSILESLGIQRPLPQRQYARRIEKRFGQAGSALLDLGDRKAAGEDVNLYPPKNGNLDLSLAVSSQSFSVQHAAFLTWLARDNNRPPRRVLDIGCENGVLTCAVALLFPDAQVIGLDREATAINRASELAVRCAVVNAQFVCTALEDFSPAEDKYDLVIAAWMFHEASGDALNTHLFDTIPLTLDEDIELNKEHVSWLRCVRMLLAGDGRFIGVNRWQTPHKTLNWVRDCESAGLELNLGLSYMLECSCKVNGSEAYPLTVHRPATGANPVTADDILALHSYPYFRDHADQSVIKDFPAEAVYRGLRITDLVYSVELSFLDGSGTERVEIGLAGPMSFHYRATTRGFRQLALGSAAFLPELLNGAIAYAASKSGIATKNERVIAASSRAAAYGITIETADCMQA